ncbi:MAG: methionine gamma-lyase family protein [Clostridia bacterium]|nr:methionine gamma-lyase family protein [Clostridia bacterium]
MMNQVKDLLFEKFNIDEKALNLVNDAEAQLKESFGKYDEIMEYNQYKVLSAFQKNNIQDRHFSWNTGYGYDDAGREAIEKVYADVFNTESALVRNNIVNGTHALAISMLGVLRPGDELLAISGTPYDTLETVIGIDGRGQGMGTLADYGITYREVPLNDDGSINIDLALENITEKTKMVHMQRATGYAWRKALSVDDIGNATRKIHELYPDIVVFVDNCYGEFLDMKEPSDLGVDLMAGSLIKNPGGGIALSGGYVVGRKDLVDMISYRLTCPGIGGECGLTFGQSRAILQGLFMAPKVVNGAIKGAALCGKVYSELGFKVCPEANDLRSDIIQAVQLRTKEALIAFCKGIQAAAPVDSAVTPVPAPMPGYDDDVIMAAGAFVQGSSIELSADGPMREPYNVYFQGGLSYEHSKFGVIRSLDELIKEGIV